MKCFLDWPPATLMNQSSPGEGVLLGDHAEEAYRSDPSETNDWPVTMNKPVLPPHDARPTSDGTTWSSCVYLKESTA